MLREDGDDLRAVALLRAECLVDVESYTKLEGKPLFAAELEREIEALL